MIAKTEKALVRGRIGLAVGVCAIVVAAVEITSRDSWAQSRTRESRSERCWSDKVGPFPKFSSSGAWTSEGHDLLLLDNYERTLVKYTAEGRFRGAIQSSLYSELQGGTPRAIVGDGKSFYIQVAPDRFVQVDDQYSYARVVARKSANGARILKVFGFAVAGEDVVAYSHVATPGGGDQGFVRFQKSAPEQFRWLLHPVSDGEERYFQLSMPYIAAIGDTAYILRMESLYSLFRNRKDEPDLHKLSALDPDKTGIANLTAPLPEFRGAQDLPAIMDALRYSKNLPVGIYAFEKRLFVLYRNWTGKRTEWTFLVVDPEKDEVVGRVEVRIDADHLTVVPGPKYWALVQKRNAEGMRDQEVTGLSFFLAQGLANLSAEQPTYVICD